MLHKDAPQADGLRGALVWSGSTPGGEVPELYINKSPDDHEADA